MVGVIVCVVRPCNCTSVKIKMIYKDDEDKVLKL